MDQGQSTCRRVGWQVRGHPLFTSSVNTRRSPGEQTSKVEGTPHHHHRLQLHLPLPKLSHPPTHRCRMSNAVNSTDTIYPSMSRQGTTPRFIASEEARAPVGTFTSTDERWKRELLGPPTLLKQINHQATKNEPDKHRKSAHDIFRALWFYTINYLPSGPLHITLTHLGPSPICIPHHTSTTSFTCPARLHFPKQFILDLNIFIWLQWKCPPLCHQKVMHYLHLFLFLFH